MKIKRFIGNALFVIGFPFAASSFVALCAPTSREPETWAHLLWAIPAAILTLPLLPFVWLGGTILDQCEREDYKLEVAHLPKFNLPDHYVDHEANLDYLHTDAQGQQRYEVHYNQYGDWSEFDSKEEAIDYLNKIGYQEVINLNHDSFLYGPVWIKKEFLDNL